jgi:hypothetical protein
MLRHWQSSCVQWQQRQLHRGFFEKPRDDVRDDWPPVSNIFCILKHLLASSPEFAKRSVMIYLFCFRLAWYRLQVKQTIQGSVILNRVFRVHERIRIFAFSFWRRITRAVPGLVLHVYYIHVYTYIYWERDVYIHIDSCTYACMYAYIRTCEAGELDRWALPAHCSCQDISIEKSFGSLEQWHRS